MCEQPVRPGCSAHTLQISPRSGQWVHPELLQLCMSVQPSPACSSVWRPQHSPIASWTSFPRRSLRRVTSPTGDARVTSIPRQLCDDASLLHPRPVLLAADGEPPPAPVCRAASKAAATSSTCRRRLPGWREPTWGGSAEVLLLRLHLQEVRWEEDRGHAVDVRATGRVQCIHLTCHSGLSRMLFCFVRGDNDKNITRTDLLVTSPDRFAEGITGIVTL